MENPAVRADTLWKNAQAAQNIKARIVECGNGVENTDPERLTERVILCERDKAEHNTRSFKAQRHDQNGFDQPDHTAEPVHIERFLDQKAAFDADAAARGEDEAHANRRHAQTAHLDQPGHHGLTKGGEMIGRVDRDQTGNADCTGRGEQRVDRGYFRAGPD